MASSSYDPNVIIRAANDKLTAGDMAGGQTLFQSALLNWVDDYQFAAGDNVNKDQLQEAVATLWIAYAHFLQKAKQFKSATEAYEQALADPVAGQTGRVWLDYARFLEDRKKLRSAQQVYLRALVDDTDNVVVNVDDGTKSGHEEGGKVVDEQDRALLWNEFLEMMRNTTNKPDLTLAALKKAIQEEHRGSSTNQMGSDTARSNHPEDVSSAARGGRNAAIADAKSDDDVDEDGDDDMYGDLDGPASKKSRTGGTAAIGTSTNAPSRTHVVLPSQVQEEEAALQEIVSQVKDDPQFRAMWMVRDGDGPPQAPEPPLFEAAPPKLTDPTGKDLLGVELALLLVARLLEPTGDGILEVSRALWTMTALQERQAATALRDFEKTILDELKSLKEHQRVQISVAGAAEDAIRTMHEADRNNWEASCLQRRQDVVNDFAWKFRELLWIQQQFFTKLKVPGFNGASMDATELEYQARICSYLHSAFFLRQRIGAKAHIKMLETQRKRLEDIQNGMGTPPRGPLNPNTPGIRLSPPPLHLPGSTQAVTGGRLSPMVGGVGARHSPIPGMAMGGWQIPYGQQQHVPPSQQVAYPGGYALPPAGMPPMQLPPPPQGGYAQPPPGYPGAIMQQPPPYPSYQQQQQQQQQQPPNQSNQPNQQYYQ